MTQRTRSLGSHLPLPPALLPCAEGIFALSSLATAAEPSAPLVAKPASPTLRQRVPYITLWSAEQTCSPRVVLTEKGIGFRREKPSDRDAHGILWRRITSKPGQGRPNLKSVHFTRQRRAMGGLLCQVCAKPTREDATSDGVLFLLNAQEYQSDPWPAPIETGQPPLCAPCAREAVNACPHLRNRWVAVRGTPRPYGVSGVLYLPGRQAPHLHGVHTVPYGDRLTAWVEASQLVIRLEKYKVVELPACS